jgi:hypothetical protein
MGRAAPDWPAQQTVRLLLAGEYATLHRQLESMFGHQLACRIILRSILGRVDETD